MRASSVKRKSDDDLLDSAKKVKQSDNMNNKDSDKCNMASPSRGDRDTEETDMFVPPGIKLLFSNLSNGIQSSHDKLSTCLDSLERDLQGKLKDLASVAIKAEVDKLRSE